MDVYLGSDHAGFKLKESIKKHLSEQGISFLDFGAKSFVKSDDYPIYAEKVAKAVSKRGFGILLCGSGQGMCIAANKIKGVRAVVVDNVDDAKKVRTHNNANVLCLSQNNVSKELANKIVNSFLFTMFSNEERHRRRLKQIANLE